MWTLPLCAICTLTLTTQGATYLLIQLYLKELGVQPIVISLSASLGWLGTLVGSVFWGALSDYRSKRGLLLFLLLSSAVTIGGLAALLSAPGVLTAVFLRVFVVTGITPIMLAVASGMSAAHDRGRNVSYISASRSLGFMMGSLLAGFFLEAVGFRGSFIFLATLPLASILFLFSFPRDGLSRPRRQRTTLRWLAKGGLWSLYIGTVLRQMGTAGAGSLIYVYMATLGIRAGVMGGVSALNPAVQVVGMLLFGQLADRVGRKRVFLLGFGASALVPLIFALWQGVGGMAAGYVVLGMAFSSLYVGSTAHIGDRIPANQQGAMLGLFESSRGLGGVLGPLLAGAVTPYIGYRGMFLTMVGVAVLGLVVVLIRMNREKTALPSHEDAIRGS